MNNDTAENIVEAILTAILQWRVNWLEEQKINSQPPPVCRASLKKLKITYDNYKDYETTFIPLLMYEIWAQIYEEYHRSEGDITDSLPMDVDEISAAGTSSAIIKPLRGTQSGRPAANLISKQFWIGVADYKTDGQYQCKLTCQYLIDANKLHSHLKLIGEGDLVSLDLAACTDMKPNQYTDHYVDPDSKETFVKLFGYVTDVNSERVKTYTQLAECYVTRPSRGCYYVVNYSIKIAKRQLRLNVKKPMKMCGLYYLKPMIRQVEAVCMLRDSALVSDILCPKLITCQLSVPTVVSIESPHYNDMQYKAIIGANEALVRNIPKIQFIQGPPGTGKTHTLIGIIKHFYLNWKDPKLPKILICAPSNGAIDEVGRRLYKEREFLKQGPARRSLRMVRVGNPDHISESIKFISLDELVESNASHKVDEAKKKHLERIDNLEKQLSKCDTEITDLRYSKREKEIPGVEAKIAHLLKELEACRAAEDMNAKRENSDAAKKNMRYELIKNTDVILTTLNSCQRQPLDALFRNDRSELSFHCVIVDEASQCIEPELLMPLCYRIFKMILIGDPMQLPATVISRHAQDYDFGRSLFERFFIHFGKYNHSSPIAMLTHQYRMHPDICHFPSKQFYDNRLVTASSWSDMLFPLKPYIMFDLMHGSENKANKTSIENQVEADFVRNLLIAVCTRAPENSKIGVITPYKGQKRLLTQRISSLQTERNIKVDVNTCDGFQGQEKDIIILSCVRAFESYTGASVGFLKSFQRVNVALTRAKYSLIVCISARSFSKDKTWQALIEDANSRKVVQTVSTTPSSNLLANMITSVKPFQQPKAFNPPKVVKLNGCEITNGYLPEYSTIPMDID